MAQQLRALVTLAEGHHPQQATYIRWFITCNSGSRKFNTSSGLYNLQFLMYSKIHRHTQRDTHTHKKINSFLLKLEVDEEIFRDCPTNFIVQ